MLTYLSLTIAPYKEKLIHLYFISIPFVLYIVYTYAPLLFKKKKILSKEHQKVLRYLSLLIATLVLLFLPMAGDIGVLLWLSVLYQSMTLTPIGTRVIHWLDNLIKNQSFKKEE